MDTAVREICKQNLISLLNDIRKGVWGPISRCPLFYEKYSDRHTKLLHLLLHDTSPQSYSNRDHFLTSLIQRVRGLERVQRGLFFVSALQCQGPPLGRLKLWGWFSSKARTIERRVHSHMGNQMLLVTWDPSWGCWPEHLHTASLHGPYASLWHGDWVLGANVPRLTFQSWQRDQASEYLSQKWV